MTRRINDTTIVHSLTDSQLLARRPKLVRLKVELATIDSRPGTVLIVGWPETDSWESVNWSGTIGHIAALLAADLGVPRDPAVVPLDAVRFGPEDHEHTGPGIEVLFDLQSTPRPHLEVVFDRMDPSGDAALWLIGALRTGAARTALESLNGVTR
jgi:hypothetical protein